MTPKQIQQIFQIHPNLPSDFFQNEEIANQIIDTWSDAQILNFIVRWESLNWPVPSYMFAVLRQKTINPS